MNIYLLEQDIIDGYDTYDSIVVCAKSEEDAREIYPDNERWEDNANDSWLEWVRFSDIDKIKVTLLGKADKRIKRGCILSSYNAG